MHTLGFLGDVHPILVGQRQRSTDADFPSLCVRLIIERRVFADITTDAAQLHIYQWNRCPYGGPSHTSCLSVKVQFTIS